MAQVYDVVIGYHDSDIEFVEKLADKLVKSGMLVWYKKSEDDGKKTTEAILGCKIYLPVMTEHSAVDKNIQEQLSLAYISNSAIYPLSQIRFRYLSPKLSGGAKLMLAKINWCFVLNMEEFDTKLDVLIKCMEKDLANMGAVSGNNSLSETAFTHGLALTHGVALQGGGAELEKLDEGDANTTSLSKISDVTSSFWDRHFSGKTEVAWEAFRDNFIKDYGTKLEEDLTDIQEDKRKFMINLMSKDIFDLKRIITKEAYDSFCVSDGPHAFYKRTQEYVVAYLSLREVLGMESSLRISTIQSLGQFSFPAIVSGLSDMLKDDDPNIRAVAAIALAHAGKDRDGTVDDLIEIIEDEDRLVRESACLSLGYLRSARAVSYVVDRWRNDPISTVREAAELALSKMDALEAQRCMKVTQVLSSEMSALKPKAAA